MKTSALKTNSGNYLIVFNYLYFFINDTKILKESDQSEYEWLSNNTDEVVIEISDELEKLLEKASSFVIDASKLEFFRNEAISKVYTFAPANDGAITIKKLSENKDILFTIPHYLSWNSVAWSGYDMDVVQLFNADKEMIGTVEQEQRSEYACNSDTNTSRDGETILEAIARHGVESSVSYIYVYHKDNGNFNESFVTELQTIYICDLDLDSLVKEIRTVAESNVA